ncbi:MAG: amidohydrolase [Clostridiales bacterium]|nr:amidohydrolase [Clostridiales bacterium]
MKKILKNAIIVTMNKDNEIIKNGQIEIENNLITYVGVSRESEGEEIDIKGNILMPGFVNTHCHLAMTLFRGYAENSNFNNWWLDYMRPLEDRLEVDDCYYGAMLGMLELIKNGVTTVADFYINPTETAKATVDTGIRTCIGVGAITGREIISEEFLDKEIENICVSEIIKPLLYAHSLYSCDESQFSEITKYAMKHNLIKSTHLSETLKEVGDIATKYNMTPVELLESYGFFDSPSILAHCVHCDKSDIEIMKNYDISVATNPSSNLILGSGIAPLYSYVKNKINVSIGTDGAASNNNLNMFKEMYLADNLQAGVLNQARAITTIDALKMATLRGALALGYDNLGRLEEGYLADIIAIDIHKPNMQPLNNIFNNLVNACESNNVIMTMVNGKIVYKDGQYYCNAVYEDVMNHCNKIIARLDEKGI